MVLKPLPNQIGEMITLKFQENKSNIIRDRIIFPKSAQHYLPHELSRRNKFLTESTKKLYNPEVFTSTSTIKLPNLCIKASNSNIQPLMSRIQSLKSSIQALKLSIQDLQDSNYSTKTSGSTIPVSNAKKQLVRLNNKTPNSDVLSQNYNIQETRPNIHKFNSIKSAIRTSSPNIQVQNLNIRRPIFGLYVQQKAEKSNSPIGNYFEENHMKKIPTTTSRTEVKRNIIQNLNLEKYIDQFKSKNVVEIELNKKYF